MDTKSALAIAGKHLQALKGHTFDLLTVTKPISPNAAVNLAKIISKLSPLLGNLIEFNSVEILNDKSDFKGYGTWLRQDPGFPDTIFQGSINPVPGFEIKAWFPLATEITARFKDSQNHFVKDNTHVAMLAWLPDKLIYGKPEILAVCVVSGKSVAAARDNHYHNPPDYIVLEPEDTTPAQAICNKQTPTDTSFKERRRNLREPRSSWLRGESPQEIQTGPQISSKLRQLFGRYSYRLDTNFAKMDQDCSSRNRKIQSCGHEHAGSRAHG